MEYNIENSKEQLEQIKTSAGDAAVELTDKQALQLLLFYHHLIEKNKVMNLTAITEFNDVLVKHFTDSLSLSRIYSPEKGEQIADLGSGAGFPGIPLKILWPETEFVLMDSLMKRVRFLEETIQICDLKGIQAVHGRAEDLGHDKAYREKFNLCVSRAVAQLASLSEYCLPLVKIGGCFAAYKAGDPADEIHSARKAIQKLGGEIEKVDTFTIGQEGYNRTLILIRKTSSTPRIYPRKAGTPAKDPIH